jgi:hypothetical protein
MIRAISRPSSYRIACRRILAAIMRATSSSETPPLAAGPDGRCNISRA